MAERHPRMIVSTEGMEGSGKTHFALSAPRPLVYLDFDYGVEGVAGGGDVERHTYDLMAAIGEDDAVVKRHARETMARFIADWRAALERKIRTLVIDTFSAAWSGQRLARSEDRYIEYEEEFRSLIRAAYTSPHTNVVLIHHLRPDWKRDSTGKSYKAGTWSRDGMDGIANMVQLAVRQRYVAPALGAAGRFELDVLKARDNIGLVGQTFDGLDFATLCAMVCPSVDWSR